MVNPLITSKFQSTSSLAEAFKLPSLSEIEKIVNKCISVFALPISGALTLFKIVKCYPVSDDIKDVMNQQSSNISFISSTFELPKLFFKQFKFYYACDVLKKSIHNGANVTASQVFKNFNTVLLKADALTGSGVKVLQLMQRLSLIDLSKVPSGLSLQFEQGKSLLSLSSSSAALVDSIWSLRDQIKKEQGDGLSLESKKEIRNVASKTIGVIDHLKSGATPEGKNFISLGSSLVSSINSIWSLSDQIEKERGKQPSKQEGISQGTKKEIRIVATKAVSLILNVIQTSAVIFCTRANPFTLALFSAVSFGLSLVKFIQANDGIYWGSGSRFQIKNSSHLPA